MLKSLRCPWNLKWDYTLTGLVWTTEFRGTNTRSGAEVSFYGHSDLVHAFGTIGYFARSLISGLNDGAVILMCVAVMEGGGGGQTRDGHCLFA